MDQGYALWFWNCTIFTKGKTYYSIRVNFCSTPPDRRLTRRVRGVRLSEGERGTKAICFVKLYTPVR